MLLLYCFFMATALPWRHHSHAAVVPSNFNFLFNFKIFNFVLESSGTTNCGDKSVRCSCDRSCLHFACTDSSFAFSASALVRMLLLNYFAVDKTGAVLRSDNFAGTKLSCSWASSFSVSLMLQPPVVLLDPTFDRCSPSVFSGVSLRWFKICFCLFNATFRVGFSYFRTRHLFCCHLS